MSVPSPTILDPQGTTMDALDTPDGVKKQSDSALRCVDVIFLRRAVEWLP